MVNTALRGCATAAPVGPSRSNAWSGRPQPRGIMITSPTALSPLAESVNEMLPLRPVAALEYDPSHWPASAATSLAVPARGTGGGGVGGIDDSAAGNRLMVGVPVLHRSHRQEGYGSYAR